MGRRRFAPGRNLAAKVASVDGGGSPNGCQRWDPVRGACQPHIVEGAAQILVSGWDPSSADGFLDSKGGSGTAGMAACAAKFGRTCHRRSVPRRHAPAHAFSYPRLRNIADRALGVDVLEFAAPAKPP